VASNKASHGHLAWSSFDIPPSILASCTASNQFPGRREKQPEASPDTSRSFASPVSAAGSPSFRPLILHRDLPPSSGRHCCGNLERWDYFFPFTRIFTFLFLLFFLLPPNPHTTKTHTCTASVRLRDCGFLVQDLLDKLRHSRFSRLFSCFLRLPFLQIASGVSSFLSIVA
jgi:hypothetical protein